MFKGKIVSILLTAWGFWLHAADIDYTKGVFVVNEDWYGHQNSTVNYLLPEDEDGEYWHYRVVQEENPGMELGCTNQYGTIWKGRFYFIAKQSKDPGAKVEGGRITVADAETMKIITQLALIDNSGKTCDGRSFIGVDEHKGYVSTSNGIWKMNLDRLEIEGQIEGSENPNPTNLYKAQCGSMVEAQGKVFAAHQSAGLLVIDPLQDKVVKVLTFEIAGESAGIGSVVKSKDGNLWVSLAKDKNGNGSSLPALVKVDPRNYTMELVNIEEGMFPPSNSWYAWTPDSFCASSKENVLFWSGGPNSWFSTEKIYRYDIDSKKQELIINLDNGENWRLYGCSMRVDPRTDELYMSLYHDFSDQTYITRRYTTTGDLIAEYPMIANYWFPSIFVFPENEAGADVSVIDSGMSSDWKFYTLNGIQLTGYPSGKGIYIRRNSTRSDKFIVK